MGVAEGTGNGVGVVIGTGVGVAFGVGTGVGVGFGAAWADANVMSVAAASGAIRLQQEWLRWGVFIQTFSWH